MKAIKFEDQINFESIKGLLSKIDEVPKDEDIILYFCSGGGNLSDCYDLVDYINRNKDRIEIVCSWEMSSAALDLLLSIHCKINLHIRVFARVHLISNSIEYKNIRNKESTDIFLLNDLNERNKIFLSQLKLCGFTNKEIDNIKLGYDVIIDVNRIKHMIKILNPEGILI